MVIRNIGDQLKQRAAALELQTAPLFVRLGVALFDALLAAGKVPSRRTEKAKVTVIETTAREVGRGSAR